MTKGFYQSFENLHRGSEEEVASRLEAYQPLLDTLHEILPEAPVLDLGCGRGEWLSALEKTGFQPEGVDTDPDMLADCQSKNLIAHDSDALAFLRKAPDNHYGIVSAFHFVEHIPFDDLKSLIEEAYRALQPGGLLILETPNPENPIIGACYFYMDPTHVKPLPPGLLQFVADYSGFQPSCVWRLSEAKGLRNQAPSLDTVLKESSPDYAVIAQKPGHDEASTHLQPIFKEVKGITLSELARRYDNHHQETADHLERTIHAEVEHMGAKLTQDLVRLNTERQALSEAVAKQQRALQDALRSEFHSVLRGVTEEYKAKIAQQEALLLDTRKLQATHDEKIRSLAIFTRILVPISRLITGSNNRLTQARRASQNGIFYQWQLIKLLKLLGLTNLAKARAERIGLTLQGAPIKASHPATSGVSEHSATGPLQHIQQALVRVLSYDKHTEHSHQTTTDHNAERTICIEGHFSGSYSLAAVNRALAMALLKNENTTLALIPREGSRSTQIHNAPANELERLRPLIQTPPVKADIAIYHHFPVIENPDAQQGTPILFFFWEESLVPEQTIAQINEHYSGVIVTSWVVKKALIDSGCNQPVAIVPLPMEDDLKTPPGPAHGTPYRFLHISSCFPRKGADVLLSAFRDLLEDHQDIELVIKTFPNPHNTIEEQINEQVPESLQSRVQLILEDYDDQSMDALYRSAHAVVLPSRGEGLNLPAIEAARYGLPVITTGYGAHTDFLTGKGVKFINYSFAPSQSHLQTPGSLWVNPDAKDLQTQCEAVLTELRSGTVTTEDTQQAIAKAFFSENARECLTSSLQKLAELAPDSKERSIILMSTWGEACGIAEYSRYLAQELLEQGASVGVWAPKHLANPSQAPLAKQLTSLECCWQPQSHDMPDALATADDTVWIQYHPGFFALDSQLEQSIETATLTGKLRFITLHATLPLLQLPVQSREQAANTLNKFYRVVVHTPSDMNVLKELGVTDNVALLPQGVAKPAAASNAEQSDSFTVACFGFLFPHKGVLELIDAFADFRQAHPEAANAKLLLLNSVHSSPASADYEQQCQQRIREKGIEAVTEFCSEFLPEETIAAKLASSNLLILPYRETPESSSAAVRTAVACCPTVAVTPARIFTEVRNATLTLPGFETLHIRQLIEQTWTGSNERDIEQVHKGRERWLAEHSWSIVASRHNRLIKAGTADARWLTQPEATQ
ncbi:glycosyltransferase [Marinobacter sp.]|uniref:glycosyltransferase n=1 Tax=Marinobacter sp. TaxID=50741 RepID=UPI003A9063EA